MLGERELELEHVRAAGARAQHARAERPQPQRPPGLRPDDSVDGEAGPPLRGAYRAVGGGTADAVQRSAIEPALAQL